MKIENYKCERCGSIYLGAPDTKGICEDCYGSEHAELAQEDALWRERMLSEGEYE